MNKQVINVEEMVLYEPDSEDLKEICYCAKEIIDPKSYAKITIKNIYNIWLNTYEILYERDHSIVNKFWNAQHKAYQLGVVIPMYQPKSQIEFYQLFKDCKEYQISNYYKIVVPTLTQAEGIFIKLTNMILENATLPNQVYMLRKNVYKYAKKIYKVDLLKGDK